MVLFCFVQKSRQHFLTPDFLSGVAYVIIRAAFLFWRALSLALPTLIDSRRVLSGVPGIRMHNGVIVAGMDYIQQFGPADKKRLLVL